MTREEREDAIDIIQSILDKYEEDECLATEITIGDEDIKAFKMAIKALEQEPCNDCISIAQAIRGLKGNALHHVNDSRESLLLSSDRNIIRALPPVTPIRPKGHWIDHSDEGYVECPMCGSATSCDDNINDLHFCFSCGADMREVEE